MSKLPISGVVVTLNEAHSLQRCLESLSFCDELLVVDSGSTDGTVELARSLGARVLHHDWPGYGAQRAYSSREARHDWVLCLDADEWLSPELAERIELEFLRGPEYRAYSFPRRNHFLGRPLKHGGDYPDRKLRLFHRDSARWNSDVVHAVVETGETIGEWGEDLMHYTAETLDQAIAKWARFAAMQARELHERGCPARVRRLVFSPLARFFKLYVLKQGFRDGVPGFAMAVLSAFFCFQKYLGLWRLAQEPVSEG